MSAEPCKGCQKPIRWVRMESGKPMPVDADSIRVVTAVYNPDTGQLTAGKMIKALVPHWSTCPNAKDFKRPKP